MLEKIMAESSRTLTFMFEVADFGLTALDMELLRFTGGEGSSFVTLKRSCMT